MHLSFRCCSNEKSPCALSRWRPLLHSTACALVEEWHKYTRCTPTFPSLKPSMNHGVFSPTAKCQTKLQFICPYKAEQLAHIISWTSSCSLVDLYLQHSEVHKTMAASCSETYVHTWQKIITEHTGFHFPFHSLISTINVKQSTPHYPGSSSAILHYNCYLCFTRSSVIRQLLCNAFIWMKWPRKSNWTN
jgi:hypothetical protein